MNPAPIRVLIADDHPVVTEGLRAVLEITAPDIEVAGEALDGLALLEKARLSPADVYVLDITMPRLNGLETLAKLLEADPATKAIILSMHDDKPTVEKALRCGARGYVLKESAACSIAEAIREVYRGGTWLSPRLGKLLEDTRTRLPKTGAGDEAGGGLTDREADIVRLIAGGLGNRQIAEELGISRGTVQVHRRNISRKLNIHKQTELVRYAIREGLAKP